MDWKKLFDPIILERGYDYYRNGNAEILSSMADEVNAVVSGSDDYEVNIYFSDGGIDDMYCDCPYASVGASSAQALCGVALMRYKTAHGITQHEYYPKKILLLFLQ